MSALIIVWILLGILCDIGFMRATRFDLMLLLLSPIFGVSSLLFKDHREAMYIGFSDDVDKTWEEMLDKQYRRYSNVQK